MFNITKKSINWGGRELTLETGKIARQADGAVFIRYGQTSLLCTIVAQKEPKSGVDYFPLTVTYQEKAFAAGKIPGGFFKREGKPTEKETLVSRLIDRPIRPLFNEWFLNETQVICTVLEFDGKNDADIPAIIGAAAAIALSGVPFSGSVAAAKVGLVEGQYVLNPELGTENKSKLDLIVAGTKTSIMMVESEAKEITEEEMLGALNFAHESMQPVIDLISEFAKEAGKPAWNVNKPETKSLEKRIKELAENGLREAFAVKIKQERSAKIGSVIASAKETIQKEQGAGKEIDNLLLDKLFKKLEMDIVRGDLVKTGARIDGRNSKQIRPILAEVGILPKTHGSALFTRGETQALVVATLGTGQDEQRIDGLDGDKTCNFMLHYNFPPYSVGEVGRMSGVGRREVGHGKLAWRAINPLLPAKEASPYTVRVVSEVTESNGSSSMATVCGTSLALMDAGVKIPRPVAGIAMGLILEDKDYVILSDILGDEDHLGDMDFKVAGTSDGVTSLQMDIKVQGITIEIMQKALAQAKTGRIHILGEMAKAITEARSEVGGNAPKFKTLNIPVAKIREVIGSGGKVIKSIVEASGAKIDIEDDGTVKVAGTTSESTDKAIAMIKEIIAEPVIGETYDGKVMKLMEFGAIVQFMGKSQGLVHISEIKEERVEKIEDVLKAGDSVRVKLLSTDRQGKMKLSMKQVNANSAANDSFVEIETPQEISVIN